MSSEQKEKSPLFIWPVRVYYEDTDCGGVVYHTSYIRFMERARSEQVISLGFGQAAWSNMQIGFAVSALQIDYLQPAKLYDPANARGTTCVLSGDDQGGLCRCA